MLVYQTVDCNIDLRLFETPEKTKASPSHKAAKSRLVPRNSANTEPDLPKINRYPCCSWSDSGFLRSTSDLSKCVAAGTYTFFCPNISAPSYLSLASINASDRQKWQKSGPAGSSILSSGGTPLTPIFSAEFVLSSGVLIRLETAGWLHICAQMQHAKSTKVQLPLLTLTPAWTVLQACRHCFLPHAERLCLVRCLVQ